MRKALVGLGLGSAAALFATLVGFAPFARTVEMKAYDAQVRLTAGWAEARRDIVLVNIDEESIRKLEPLVGRFPWPRLVHAQLVAFLTRAPVAAIAYDVLFSERDRTSFSIQGDTWTGAESDAAFVEAVRKAGNVVVAADATGEAAATPAAVPVGGYRLAGPIERRPAVTPPFEDLARAARAVGHSFLALDADGPARRSVPFVRTGALTVPSLAVATALLVSKVGPDRVFSDGDWLTLGAARMPLVKAQPASGGTSSESRRALIRFVGGRQRVGPSYEELSFYRLFYSEMQLQAGQSPLVDPARLRGKIVVVGVTAAGLHDTFAVPLRGAMPGSAIHATVVDNILSRRFMHPAPAYATAIVALVGALAVGLACVLLGAWPTVAAAIVALAALCAFSIALIARGTWLAAVQPAIAITAAAFVGVSYQYFVEGREKRRIKRVFSRMVAPDVYRHLVDDPSRARLGGERREMSVLFADLRGFTTLTENGRPEDVVAQLNEYFTRMVDVLFQHQGTVDKFVGDMVMALFGAPVGDARHADCAVQAALHMVRALAELNARWEREGRPRLAIGVGINSGEMIVGNVGSEQIMSYTVIGDAVNLASRLESLNKQFGTTILISDGTRRLLSGQYLLDPLGEVTVKGKSVPVLIYCVREK
ncbi:MAG: CHASE2 domain-containing protein [Bacteroidales bacterium]